MDGGKWDNSQMTTDNVENNEEKKTQKNVRFPTKKGKKSNKTGFSNVFSFSPRFFTFSSFLSLKFQEEKKQIL